MNALPRLVAFDVDGTLVGRDLTISKRVREAVARMQQAGTAGSLVTGRMYRATLPFARELEFEAPVICYQGAAIIDPASDEILAHSALRNEELVLELVSLAERDRMHLQLYRNDEYYCETRNRYTDLYASLSMTQPVVVPSLREAFAYSPATKAVIIADEPVAARYSQRLSEVFQGRANVTRSLPEFVEVLDLAADKGAALRFCIAAQYGESNSRKRSPSATPGTTHQCCKPRVLRLQWARHRPNSRRSAMQSLATSPTMAPPRRSRSTS